MELWVNGKKRYTETNSLTLNTTVTLPPAYNEYDIYAINTDGQKWETTVFGNTEP